MTSLAAALSWQDFAACKGVDPESFATEQIYPDPTVKRICDGCPVNQLCLDDADGDNIMVRGGYTARQRDRIRRGESPYLARAIGRGIKLPAETVSLIQAMIIEGASTKAIVEELGVNESSVRARRTVLRKRAVRR